jgi:hypothetical protein
MGYTTVPGNGILFKHYEKEMLHAKLQAFTVQAMRANGLLGTEQTPMTV